VSGERSITRRRFLASVGVLGTASVAAGIDGFAIEPERVEVTANELRSPESARDAAVGAGAVLASSVNGPASLSFVQLSDLHLQRVAEHEERVAAAVKELDPDFLVITGDSIDNRHHLHLLDGFLALLDHDLPKYAIMGNWEHACRVNRDRLREVYESHGCRLLVNESAVHDHGGRELLITGLDDLLEGRSKVADALRDVEPRADHIILAHCPVQRDVLLKVRPPSGNRFTGIRAEDAAELSRFSPSCVLSGHTHGGQVNLFGFAPWRPRGSGPYVNGWYRDVQPALYVSRGIGTVTLPIRLGSAPEVASFRWLLA
jgi:predicted MPP superfamily phosphohydrolase